jgi:hypothetical protein
MARDVEFNVTASDRTGNAMRSAARELEKTQKRIRDDAEKAFGGFGRSLIAAGNLAGPKVGQAITKGIAHAAQLAGPLLASAAAYAAPLIAGTLSAAIVGGAGVGGVIGGVLLAARDPRVAAAGRQLGDQMFGDLTDAGRPFVDETLSGIEQVRAGWQRVQGNIRNIFATSARFVGPLTAGVVAFGESLVRGFDTLISKANPVINEIRDGLTRLGTSWETFAGMVAGDGQAAAASMRQIFDLLSGTLLVLGPIIAGLNEINQLFDALGGAGILQFVATLARANAEGRQFGTWMEPAASGFTHVNGAAANYAQTLENLAAAHRRVIGENNTLYSATTSAAQAYRDATAAVKANGETLSLNTKAGLANRQTLANLATQLNTQYDAYVKLNGAGESANEVLRRNRQNFIEVATKASGSAAAARRLADDLIGIPDRKPKLELLDNATGKINNVINRLAAVKSKTVTVNIAVKQSGDASALRKQNAPAYNAASPMNHQAGPGGQHRTGGPTPIRLTSSTTVLLDGRPFDTKIEQAVTESEQRTAWRRRVGGR